MAPMNMLVELDMTPGPGGIRKVLDTVFPPTPPLVWLSA